MKVENLHYGVAFLGEPFLTNMLEISGNSTGCLLFICNYVIAIIKYSTTSTVKSNFIFDSHGRNGQGITHSPFGFSVLLQFADIVQVERYTEDAYNIANRDYPLYIQIQFLFLSINESHPTVFKFCQINLFRSIKRKKSNKKVLGKNGEKKTHTEVRREKAKDRTRETRSRHNILRNNYDSKGLVYLRQLFSQRKILSALFVKMSYGKSLTLFSEIKHKELLSDLFNFICSNDNKFYICKALAKIVSKNPISCQAAFKKLKIYY